MADMHRPAKLIVPDVERHYRQKPPPKGGPKPFVVTGDFKGALLSQLDTVEKTFGAALGGGSPIPVVASVRMKRTAIAKTHRPWGLFTNETCPIIGARDFGDLLVSIRPSGLDFLRQKIRNPTKDNLSALTKIEAITPYTASAAMGRQAMDLQVLAKKAALALRVRLFDHRNKFLNDALVDAFRAFVRTVSPQEPSALRYVTGLPLFKVTVNNPDAVVALAHFVGVRSLDEIPAYVVEEQSLPLGPITDDKIPLPEDGADYPVIGLLDSGTDPTNARLQAWVVGRDEADVPRGDQDHRHGTFIAGLLINARGLNHNDPRFPLGKCKLFDAVVIPKSGGAPHPEPSLLESIRRVIRTNHKRVKIWNLSISSVKNACCDDAFSPFAMALDEIQDLYDVTIVTCTGNLKPADVCKWPRDSARVGEGDRMLPAADSVRAISVSSVSHRHVADSLSKEEEASPFSRRGPGPAFHPKPEVSHYGGNCNAAGAFSQTGILSLDMGRLVERVGTSYSVPLVASMIGNLRQDLANPASRNLVKALLVHSAVLGNPNLSIHELRYRGFGIPCGIESLVNCPPWAATMIFEPRIEPNRNQFVMPNFPIPPCFRRRDGTVEGEFLITLAYDPPLDADEGAEYCRINIDVSLGTYDSKPGSTAKHSKKIPLEPSDASEYFESNQLEHGYKWSPLKVCRTKLSGTGGKSWRLLVDMLTRTPGRAVLAQNAAIVITLHDRQKPTVYDEVVREMTRAGWASQDVQIRSRARVIGRQ